MDHVSLFGRNVYKSEVKRDADVSIFLEGLHLGHIVIIVGLDEMEIQWDFTIRVFNCLNLIMILIFTVGLVQVVQLKEGRVIR